MKVYIVPIYDDSPNHDEIFVEYIREHATEIVRCKDCKHWLKTTITYEEGDPVYTCPKLTMDWGDEDGYCFMGERKA